MTGMFDDVCGKSATPNATPWAKAYVELAKAVGRAGFDINSDDGDIYLTSKDAASDHNEAIIAHLRDALMASRTHVEMLEAAIAKDAAPAGGEYRGVIPQALDETINGVVSDLEIIAAGRDQVTGDPVSGLQSQRIAKSAHDRLLSAWNACENAPAQGDEAVAEVRYDRGGVRFLIDSILPDRTRLYLRPEDSAKDAPAGSGEVEAFARKLEQIADERTMIQPGSLREAAALLRKLQQGAE